MIDLIVTSVGVFLGVILLLVIILLIAKGYLSPSGTVKIILNGKRELETSPGSSLLGTMAANQIFLSSACGGKGSCAQCKCQIPVGGGEILPTETVHFSRKEQAAHWRLGCQVKVKQDMEVILDNAVLGVKKWECEVVSNKNVATFIKEFVVKLPEGEHLDFTAGGYSQIDVPNFTINYRDFDIDKAFQGDWDKFKMWDLNCTNDEPAVRAYSMANYPAEGDVIILNVRIATPPFDPATKGFMKSINPGIASSYIFSLKPGDKVIMSGPYGDFHPILSTKNEMLYIGGGAGMAPLRAHILHLLKTLEITDRKISYWYGARSKAEIFYEEDFRALEQQFPNFTFNIALSAPLPEDNWTGYVGFIHHVIRDNYLTAHETPEDIEYYMCGPGPMSKAVGIMLDDLGVPPTSLLFDDFGA